MADKSLYKDAPALPRPYMELAPFSLRCTSKAQRNQKLADRKCAHLASLFFIKQYLEINTIC